LSRIFTDLLLFFFSRECPLETFGKNTHAPRRALHLNLQNLINFWMCAEQESIAMRMSCGVVFLLTILAGTSLAQVPVPKINIFAGYSYLNADTNTPNRANLNGWEGSVEGKVFPFLGLVLDASGHYGTEQSTQFQSPGGPGFSSVQGKLHTVLFGPRVSISVHGVRPFAHVLVGGAVISQSLGGQVNDVSFATAVGGGVDFKLTRFAGWRVQGDLLRTQLFGETENNVRVSTGLVFHF
jgi:hypothetical protein